MEQPPPRRRSESLRRSPKSRHEETHRAQGFAHAAFAAGVGDDIGALTSSLPASRFQLSGIALRLVVVIVVVAALVVAVSVFANRPTEASAIPSPQSQEASIEAAATSASTSPSEELHGESSQGAPLTGTQAGSGASMQPEEAPREPAQVVVHISGEVRTPGVVTVDPDSRVNDVVEQAGGLSEQADSARINLAAKVADGDHVHIPAVGGETSPGYDSSGIIGGEGGESQLGQNSADGGGGSEPGGVVNINTASATELELIPGVGPVTAQAILEWRDTNGAFTSIDQLLQVNGIGPKTLERLRPHVSV